MEKTEEFVKKLKLRWFGHFERMDDDITPVKQKKLSTTAHKKVKLRKDKKDMLVKGLRKIDAQDHSLWRLGCKIG